MSYLWWSLLAVWTLAARVAAVVGGDPAAAPEPDAAVVFVQKFGNSARLEGLKNDHLGYYSFFGIRYAQPPVGPRRFQRPVRQYLAGDVSAQQYCAACPQPDPRNPRRIIGNEDCLCLNVYAPKMPGDEQGCPVVFFIHGGNYKSGSTASYGGQHLTQKDTILVTAQYRLGSLGFLSTGQRDASGNAGMFDLRAAMAWIQDYIEFFGGDPTRIAVMGQGSGASAGSLMALSYEGRSARGVVALSGTPLSPGAVRTKSEPEQNAKQLAKLTNCPEKPAERLLNCLRQLPFEKIIEADRDVVVNMDTTQFLSDIAGRSGPGVRVEGQDDLRGLPPMVADDPAESLHYEKKKVPLLTGVTSAETSRAVFGKYSKFLTDKLSAVKDFIKNDLVGGLKSAVAGVNDLVPKTSVLLPLNDYYQALFDNSLNSVDGLSQIAEATGDALFNFPAYQTVKSWAASGPAFLYSFEHSGNLTKGSYFLPGVPLADDGNETTAEGREAAPAGPAHGDELAYIFEPLDEQGRSVSGEVSSTDARVRDNFVGLIAKFAHNLNNEETANTSNILHFRPFSKNLEQYLKINEKVSLDKNFRFCQMGLWGNMADRVSGALCKEVLGSLLNLPKLPLPIPVTLPTNKVLPNLLGGMVKTTKTTVAPKVVQVERTTKQSRRGGLGLSGLLNGI